MPSSSRLRAFPLLTLVAVAILAACGDDEASGGGGNGTGNGGGGGGGGGGGLQLADGGASLGAPQKGLATYYAATGKGSCLFEASPNDLMVVAPNRAKYWENSALCGGCLKVTGAKGSVIVRVVDSCPIDQPENDCGDTGADLDLSAQAFAQIDDPKKGKIEVTFELVACTVQGPMQYRFKEGSSQYWTAIQVRNIHIPVSKLEYKKDGAWVDIPRVDYNYFIAQKGVGLQPNGLALRVTGRDGQTVEETLPGIADGQVVTGTQQFK